MLSPRLKGALSILYDVLIVGGSFAGLSAALQLGRARRRVVVFDSGLPRNRYAAAAHGVLGHDGKAPAALLGEARKQVSTYPTVALVSGEVAQASNAAGRFAVRLADGRSFEGRRVILATGISDTLPDIPGLKERWGATVLHCPYCHGYEMRDRLLGVLATHPMAAHQAAMLPDWGPTVYFSQGRFEPDEKARALLSARGVVIERQPVAALLGDAPPALEAVALSDGRRVSVNALFVAPATQMASSIAHQLGCAFEEGVLGPVITTDDWKATTVRGVYAAGDAARAMHSITLAMADGAMAGVGAHQSLVRETPGVASGGTR